MFLIKTLMHPLNQNPGDGILLFAIETCVGEGWIELIADIFVRLIPLKLVANSFLKFVPSNGAKAI